MRGVGDMTDIDGSRGTTREGITVDNPLIANCPYCGKCTELVTGDVIYPRRPELHRKKFYLCKPCDAYVGCHPGTENPLGRLANKELRRAKMRAHAAFDPLWQDGKLRRREAYAALASMLGIDVNDCHIGMFDIEMCAKAEACARELLRSSNGKSTDR